MFVSRKGVCCLFFVALFATSAEAQDYHAFKSLDSLGLDAVLFLETGYFTNTRDGYTVVQGDDQRWYYATLNQFGNVVPSEMRLGALGKRTTAERAFLHRATRHLETEPVVRDQLERSANEEKAAIERSRTQLTEKGFTTGSRDILVLAIEFPDHRAAHSRGYLDSLMNINTLDSEPATGSFRDYYIENSYGKFVPESHVYGWFEAEHPLAFYTDTLGQNRAAARLAEEALKQADAAGVDFSPYDFNGNGKADPVMIVTSVRSTVIKARFSELLMPLTFQNLTFAPYTIQDVHLGNLVHEYGHALGLADLHEGHSLGYYDVMALSCFGEPPGHFSAYSKIKLGWIDPLVIDESTKDLEVPNSHNNPFAVEIHGKNAANGRYFVIENRIRKGYDSGGFATISSSGLLIYHIDERDRRWSHVEQADGRLDLERYESSNGTEGNAGDAGDFFHGPPPGKTQFDRETRPGSREDDGRDTGVDISGISAPGYSMWINVELRESFTRIVPEGRWEKDQIHSTSLEGAPLGPSTERPISVYLPAAYDEFPNARFPVLYLLAPTWPTTETSSWMGLSEFITRFGGSWTLDAAFDVEGIRPMIVVLPDGMDQIPHFYNNSYLIGDWEDFVTKDLVSYIDGTYRTIPDSAGRGISGLQMTGYGAIMIAMRHPDLFQAVYGLSPVALAIEDSYLIRFRDGLNEVAADPPHLTDFPSLRFQAQVAVATCLSFAPDSTASPLPCNLPVDRQGNVIEDVWDQWLRHDPHTLLDSTKYQENLHRLNGFGFDIGLSDTWAINEDQLFHQALAEAGIPHAYREFHGVMGAFLEERIGNYLIPFISEHVEGNIVTSIDGERPRDRVVPHTFALHQNYPNPFNPSTTIRYDLPEAATVRLTVFDALGRTVRVVGTGYQVPGTYAVTWDATDLPSGVYFYRLEAGDYVATRSLLLVK